MKNVVPVNCASYQQMSTYIHYIIELHSDQSLFDDIIGVWYVFKLHLFH